MAKETVDWRLWYDIWVPVSLLCAAAFLAVPGIDLALSGLVGDPSTGFPLAAETAIRLFRAALLAISGAVLIGATGAAMLCLLSSPWRRIAGRETAFALSAFALGPGLLVDGVLKRVSGRVRPMNVEVFGGPFPFQKAFDFSGPCGADCSFPSAETAAVAVAMMCLVLIAGPRLGARAQIVLTVGAVLATLAVAAIRVAVGAHFPSDVVASLVLMTALVPALHILFGLGRLSAPTRATHATARRPT